MTVTRYKKSRPSQLLRPSKSFIWFALSECLIFSLIGWIGFSYGIFSKPSSQVLSASTVDDQIRNSVEPTPTQSVDEDVTVPSPTPQKLSKDSYTIAIVGDSMVDTMGDKLEYLEDALKSRYPDTQFHLYNYGKGSENVEEALDRVNTEFSYKTRHFPILYKVHPDVIIIGSYAYNPFAPYDRDRHWLGLTHLIQEIQKISPNVYLLAEIAPLRAGFGIGPHGVNWDTTTNYVHSQHIIEQLENARGLAKTLNVLLIDTYAGSLEDDGKVIKRYVSVDDGIHPSEDGHVYMAKKIAETIVFK